jgi:hypothetical protein
MVKNLLISEGKKFFHLFLIFFSYFYRTLWTVPLSYYTSFIDKTSKIEFIKSDTQTIDVNPDPMTNGLIKFNVDFTGMYFVNYPIEDWDKWISALVLNTGGIVNILTPSDRAEFIIDSFYLSRANYLPYLKPFELSKYLVNEPHFTPWSMFNSMFDSIRKYMSITDYKDSLNIFLSQISEKQYIRLLWDDHSGNEVDKRLRALIVELSCSNEYQKCLADAYTEFRIWKEGHHLAPNLRGSILRYGFRHSNIPSDFELLWDHYLNEETDLKLTFLNALAYSRDINQLKE